MLYSFLFLAVDYSKEKLMKEYRTFVTIVSLPVHFRNFGYFLIGIETCYQPLEV